MTDSRPIGSRVSAGWRIVGWLLLTVLLGQLAVITTVHSTLHADVARQANEDVIQELEEFRDLASDGRDPATARPFEDPRRLVTVFLDRQRPSPGEHLFGQFDDGQVIEAYGPATTQARALELSADPAAMAQITVANSGVMQTAPGEMRWGRIDLQDAQGQPAGRFVMGIFVAGAEQEANRVVLLLTAVCAGVLLFTAFVSWLVAGQILKPVRTMRRTAETISAYDLQQRLPVSGRDDIAALGRTVNTLFDRLQGALATEQRFVDTAGAELRDPVRRGTARLAALARENPAAGARLQPIRDDLAGMERTITELTSLAATQRATFVQPVRTTTGALAERVRGWLPTIAVRDWRETRVDELSLTADPDRLMEAVRHLAENAAEHGSPDDPIDWWIHRVEVAGDPPRGDRGARPRPRHHARGGAVGLRSIHGLRPRPRRRRCRRRVRTRRRGRRWPGAGRRAGDRAGPRWDRVRRERAGAWSHLRSDDPHRARAARGGGRPHPGTGVVTSPDPAPTTSYRTPSPRRRAPERRVARRHWLRSARLWSGLGALGLIALVLLADHDVVTSSGETVHLGVPGLITLVTFVAAVWAWAFTPLDDTFVALVAGTVLVLAGVLDSDRLFATLGDDTIWLLVSAFVIAARVTSSGLSDRAACWLVAGATGVRSLVHLITAALVVTTFAVPATSGRAALTLPVFIAIATVLAGRGEEYGRLIRALALLFPTVILLSAVGSLLGAGAHLVTSQVVQTATGEGFSFAQWLLLGLPLALVSSHLAAELVVALFLRRDDRDRPIDLSVEELSRAAPYPVTGPMSIYESRAALIVVTVVILWCTASLHGVHPAIVALIGALITTSPRYGSTRLKDNLKKVPWSLLLFLAATLALGDALMTSGAAQWMATTLFAGIGIDSSLPFMIAVVVVSTLAHLVIQSRSARSAVLVPIVVALAPTMGVSPAAAAFASTAAAGFCHTLPASAKPVAMFSAVTDVPTYTPADLRRLSLLLAPLTAALVLLFSYTVWPLLGLPL
ncbi:SLC13 family permease [Piscicoccus intestinalis]|uniref:SLC13 family permease n=1 Tax=Piscicoccus intestinalis TaxID=746033 RepID=UPI000A836567|nr:SLC13 family permease [Piscicoccus intestinalis]